MALPSEISRSFRLYVTHVDGEGHFLKISGQLDQQSSLMIESLFETSLENLEKGIGAVPPAAIREGIICAAKYKDGTYYRAKIINITNLATGLVGVHFIDYGNKDIISLSTIRFLDSYDPMFLQLRGQATDYYLSRVMHPSGRWEEPLLLKLQSLLCYAEYPATIELQTRTPIIAIQFKGNDLSTHLVSNRFGIALPIAKQEVLLLQLTGESQQVSNWQPSFVPEPAYTEHIPFLINQNFPSNPASAMRLQQNVSLPFNGSVPPPSMISQRLMVNKVSRTPVNLKAPIRQPQQVVSQTPQLATPPQIAISDKPPSPKKSATYKSRLLEVNSQHKVFVSFAEEGPELFAVQLVSDAKKLQDMMDEINRRPHSSLAEPPMIGTVCLGRMSGDRIICRAIVMNLSGSQCKLFFVDFGDTEMVSYYDIFDIPEEFVKPNVFAMRFCLSGVKKLGKGNHLIDEFRNLVNGKVLTLRVVSPEGPPLIQYGELYLDNKNVFDLLLANINDSLQFKWMEMLPWGSKRSILVSYVDSCVKFFIQLSDKIDELNAVMDAVKVHCESTSSPGEFAVGAACCARFPDDDNWYRARITDTKGDKVTVTYVDYGNEQEINVADLRTITPELIQLPAQALKCALKGYESKPVESKTSNQLEMLALEKTLMAHIVGILSNDTMLVSLVDDTTSPPLDIARKMMQLSQPRNNIEGKPTTPVRKDAPESFSSPEGSEDNRKKSFRREKSFKEDRRPPRDTNDDFGQRSGSFRGRDLKDTFDRSGPSRHSEKFGGRSDKGERRGKPRESNAPPPPAPAATSAGDDEWEEISAEPTFQSPPPPSRSSNRDNPRDRENINRYHQQDEWEDTRPGGRPDSRPDTRSDNRQDSRPDRRDNRTERPWGEKRDFQKREFRDNNRERGDRTRSNFNPRDRAEKSFGSDGDRKSDKSTRSQDSGGRSGRAPPHKTRGKFTEVHYKELSDPVPLETPFEENVIELNTQHEVSVTWIISPESFYTQILSLQPNFLEMMHKIPELYKGVRSYAGMISVGASVLARYPADGVLYRATVVSIQPFSKFIVQYIDFGNKQLVDAKDIWQLDRQLMELPKMAVHCSLLGVAPKDGEWKMNPDVDLCFNAPRYQCVFENCVEGQWKVYLWNNGVNVADMLVEKELAITSDHQSSVALKDEAIDLTIIVGQQIFCKVTHVESFEKFYVQLDLDKAAKVESAINNYDTKKLTPLLSESLAEGVHCTVSHDGKIHRAILNDVSDTENIQAVLPDYGISITTPLANLMILPTELSIYYYQSLECSLNNYTEESNKLLTLEELKARLSGNKFIIYINDVDGITLVATLYDIATGQKVAIFEPDEGAYDAVTQLCVRAVFNYNFGMAYISHSENLNEIYLQKTTDSERIAQLLDDMYKFYEEGTPDELSNFDANAICAAKSSDGNWYRATIITTQETEVKVQFSDYGNFEIMPKESLKKLDTQFFEPCALALVAGLGLVALQDDALAKLIEWTTDKEVQVTLAFGTDGWLASLHLDGVDLAIKLVNEKLATPKLSDEEPKDDVQIEELVSLPEGCTQVYISHIDTPGHFWLQIADKVDKIEEIQAELQANASSYTDIENRELGTLCVAKYLADDKWYRAEILDSDSDITTVRFIDYGNTDVLDNQPDLIKVMPDHLKEIERYGLKSSVNAVPTGTGEWSEPASDYFTELVGYLSNPVDALIVLKDVTTYVDIFVNGQNLTDKLVSEGYATKAEKNEFGDLPSCFASHINSPSEFWIQLETATHELQTMEAAMVDAENFPTLTEKEEGVICAAKYPEDGAWYRAQIIVDGSEGTEVLFMDYGNASIANELRSLPNELKVKPALSRKCALQKPRDIKSWSRKSEIKFNELAAEGATIFNIQFIASGDISIVELYLEGKSVTEELVGLCEEYTTFERPTPTDQVIRSSGKVCFVRSLTEIYLQLDENTSLLDTVTKRLVNSAEFEPVKELKVGLICAGLWYPDEHWYRVRVLDLYDDDDGSCKVVFIDYAIKQTCYEFRQLPNDLAAIPPLAKRYRLAEFSDDYEKRRNIEAKLEYLAIDHTTLQIEFIGSKMERSPVKLFVNDADVITISDGAAVPDLSIRTNNKCEDLTETIVVDVSTTEIQNDKIDLSHEKEIVEMEGENRELEMAQSRQDNEGIFDDNEHNDLNTSQPDLNESVDSSNTVIENKSFETKVECLSDDYAEEVIKDEPLSPPIDGSSDTIENSDDTIKTPERDDSKDSLNTDTGYTSGADHDKSPFKDSSPLKEIVTKSLLQDLSPVKESTSESPMSGASPIKETISESLIGSSPGEEVPSDLPLKDILLINETASALPTKQLSPVKDPLSPKKEQALHLKQINLIDIPVIIEKELVSIENEPMAITETIENRKIEEETKLVDKESMTIDEETKLVDKEPMTIEKEIETTENEPVSIEIETESKEMEPTIKEWEIVSIENESLTVAIDDTTEKKSEVEEK